MEESFIEFGAVREVSDTVRISCEDADLEDWRKKLNPIRVDDREPCAESPFYVDLRGTPAIRNFTMPRSKVETSLAEGRSRRILKGGRELLFRALGKKENKVWDASGGLLRDAKMIYDHGYDVTVLERNSWLYTLATASALHASAENLRPKYVTGRSDYLELQKPDVIYYDPMFPQKKKSAASALENEWLKALVGTDPDAEEWAQFFLSLARNRMVIKRPLRAEPLRPGPSHSFSGKSVRYDLYLAPSS